MFWPFYSTTTTTTTTTSISREFAHSIDRIRYVQRSIRYLEELWNTIIICKTAVTSIKTYRKEDITPGFIQIYVCKCRVHYISCRMYMQIYCTLQYATTLNVCVCVCVCMYVCVCARVNIFIYSVYIWQWNLLNMR